MTHGTLFGMGRIGLSAVMNQIVGPMGSISARWVVRAGFLKATLRAFIGLLAAAGVPVISVAIGLNDTGVDQCGELSAMSATLCTTYSSDSSAYPRQDGILGRDALARAGNLPKIGAGSKGFDFTKIANNGSELPASASQGSGTTDWACTRDNVTGLVWEVKTTSGLHNSVDTFSWYKAGVGTPNGGTCQTSGNCDTEKFVVNVNNVGFCGFSDWRMPSVKELEGLADIGLAITNSSVAIDSDYFPNGAGTDIAWTATNDPTNTPTQFAYAVKFASGAIAKYQLATNNKIRLVRGSPVSRQFVLSGNVVLDASYGLMWKRDYEMLIPGSPSPSVNVDTFTWSDALKRAVTDTTGGYNDWRLPNMKELRSLVDETRFDPAMDPIFNALLPASVFWSSSPARSYANYTNLSWVVQFDNGVNLSTMGRSAKNYVRLVRNLAVGEQTISTVGFLPTTLAVNGTTVASATGGASGNPVTFSSNTPSVCTVGGTNGSTITALHAGTCTVAANQAGNMLYAPAPTVTQNITVNKASQTIGVVTFLPTSLAINGTTTASATASSGLAVSFSSNTTGICTTSGTNGRTITGVTSGTCTLTASLAESADYLAAPPVTGSITVKIGQTISSVSFSPLTVKAGETTTASATGGASGNPVTFSTSSPTTICTVNSSSGVVTAVGVGNCVVIANQAGNDSYAAALPVSGSISVAKGTQSIGAIGFAPQSLTVGTATTASAVATSGLAVSFGASPQSTCTVLGAVVTGKQFGTCTVVAYQKGNDNFEAADPVAINLPVGQGAQTIGSISFVPSYLAVDGTSTASAVATSNLPVTFTSTTTGTCTVGGTNGSIITGVASGTCTIRASQAGDLNYLAAPSTTANVVVKTGQSITNFIFTPSTLTVATTTQASASGGTTLNPVTFSTSSASNICTVTVAGVVTGTGLGNCVVTANLAGDETHTPAQATQTIAVGQGSQTIGPITLLGSLSVGSTSTAHATATSGLAVIFTASPPETCEATGTNGSTIKGLAAGPCTISANQFGNANFAAALQVQFTPSVLLNQTITSPLTFTPTGLVVGGSTTVSATGGGSGNPVVFDSATPSSCTVSGANGSVVTGQSIGPCLITANQAGNGTYAEANPVVDDLVIVQGTQTIGSISIDPSTLRVGGFTTASATATSGYPVTFSSTTPTVCTVSGTHGQTVTGVSIGTCTIKADQDGMQDGLQNYDAASTVTRSFLAVSTIEFSPAELTFDPQSVGSTSAAKVVTLTNHSTAVLNISSLASTISVFAVPVNTNTCGSTLAAGANCTFGVTFTPSAVETRVGAIRVASNAATTPDNLTPVTGRGIAPPAPTCTLTPTPSRVAPGRSSTLTATCSGSPTSYAWTGGTCAGTTASTCTVSPASTTVYGVIATNAQGSSNAVTATVTVGVVDLTPILMLLLD